MIVALRRWPGWFVVASAGGAIACNAILGMDAPSLNPCATGCPDGSTDDGATDAAPDGPVVVRDAAPDAQSDAAPPAGSIRCGGGAYPTSWCIGATPLCCQGGTTSAPTFTCVANAAACTGYAIECANYNDCSGTEICCRFMLHQVCDVPANCPNSEIVCQTDMSDSCPTGYTCNVPFVGDAAAKSAYLGCSQ